MPYIPPQPPGYQPPKPPPAPAQPGDGFFGGVTSAVTGAANAAVDAARSAAVPKTPFAPATPMEGDFNLQNPGYAENFFTQNQGAFSAPTNSQGVYDQAQGQLGQQQSGAYWANGQIPQMTADGQGEQFYAANAGQGMNHAGGSNMATQVFEDYRQTAGRDPGLSTYYDNAGRQALEKINQNAAARGTYGSSAALAEGSEALTNLAADRAKNEADYNLRRLQTGSQIGSAAEDSQRGWFDSVGDQAFRADEADLARDISGVRTALDVDRADRERIETLGGLAGDADTATNNRLTTGMNASATAQDAREGRIGGLFDDISGFGTGVSNAYDQSMGNLPNELIDLLTLFNQATMGGPSTGLGYDTYEANQHRQNMQDGFEIFKQFFGGGMGGMGGGA